MNPWVMIMFVMAGIVFGLDYLFRRKKWNDNTKQERISLLINMFSVGPYIFLSALGMLWGIVSGSAETAFGETLNDATLVMAGVFFIVAIVAVIMSFILRKIGKIKASIWINVIALLYIVAVFGVNYLAGEFM